MYPSHRYAVRSRARRVAIAAAIIFAATGAPASAASATAEGRSTRAIDDPRKQVRGSTLGEPGQFALDFFLYLNSPGDPNSRGQPLLGGKLGQPGPTVWETFKNVSELYRPAGATPPGWSALVELPLPPGTSAPTPQQLQQQFGPADSPWLHFLSQNTMIDGLQVVDANGAVIQYDVRCNAAHFNFVVNNGLFSYQGQNTARLDPNFNFTFPSEAVEVKAAWRVLGPNDDPTRYWTAYGAYLDSKQNLVYARIGLTAIHMISNSIPGWIWLTYEQADNPTATFTLFKGQPGKAVGANPTQNPAAAPLNRQLQRTAQSTKWQFYRIIGWQTDETDSQGRPVLLANSNIETYFPQNSSCKSCHAMANVGPPEQRRLTMWDTSGGGITGRIGKIDFAAIARQVAPPGTQFRQEMFVWSLREAQSTFPAANQPDRQ